MVSRGRDVDFEALLLELESGLQEHDLPHARGGISRLELKSICEASYMHELVREATAGSASEQALTCHLMVLDGFGGPLGH